MSAANADRMILRGALSTAAGFAIRFGARFLFLFVAGRLFGAVLFGAYSLAVAVVEAALGLAGLSLKKTLFQLLDQNEEKGERPDFHIVLDAALLVLLASGAIAALIMLTAATLPRSILPEATATALFWIAPMIGGQALADILVSGTRWKHAIRYEVIGRSLVEPYALVTGALAAYWLGFRDHGLIAAYWAGNIALNIYAVAGVKRCFGDLHLGSYRPPPGMWRTLRSLLPNTGTDLLSGIYVRMDLYLVGILMGERWAGIYGMAQQLRTPIRQVRQSFDALLVPIVTRTLSVKGTVATGEALATASRFILSLQAPVLILLVAIGAPLLEWFGPGFAAGYVALLLLAAAEMIHGTFGLGDLLFVYRSPVTGLRITLASIAVGVAAAFLLIPQFGISGGALSVLVAYGLQAVLRRRALRSKFDVKVPLVHSAGPLLAGAAGVAVLLLAGGANAERIDAEVAASLGAALALYALLLFGWARATGQSLSIKGFAAGPADVKPDASPDPPR